MRSDQIESAVYRGFNMEQENQLNVYISNVLAKFQTVSGLNFELKKEQETAFKKSVDGPRPTGSFADRIWKKFYFPNLCDGARATKRRHKRFHPGNFPAYQHNPGSDCRSKVT